MPCSIGIFARLRRFRINGEFDVITRQFVKMPASNKIMHHGICCRTARVVPWPSQIVLGVRRCVSAPWQQCTTVQRQRTAPSPAKNSDSRASDCSNKGRCSGFACSTIRCAILRAVEAPVGAIQGHQRAISAPEEAARRDGQAGAVASGVRPRALAGLCPDKEGTYRTRR
jgi:hypothetical protein